MRNRLILTILATSLVLISGCNQDQNEGSSPIGSPKVVTAHPADASSTEKNTEIHLASEATLLDEKGSACLNLEWISDLLHAEGVQSRLDYVSVIGLEDPKQNVDPLVRAKYINELDARRKKITTMTSYIMQVGCDTVYFADSKNEIEEFIKNSKNKKIKKNKNSTVQYRITDSSQEDFLSLVMLDDEGKEVDLIMHLRYFKNDSKLELFTVHQRDFSGTINARCRDSKKYDYVHRLAEKIVLAWKVNAMPAEAPYAPSMQELVKKSQNFEIKAKCEP